MAVRGALPTMKEIDQMKFGQMIQQLQELGMTLEEMRDMEKEDAKVELKRKVKHHNATVATRRRPGQITEMLQSAMSENREKRKCLKQICKSILDFVVSMDHDDKQQMNEFFQGQGQGQGLKVLEDVRKFLQNDCHILVVGETSSGKSSLLNLLLGKDILPESNQPCTSTLCFVKYGGVKRATVYLKESNPVIIDLLGTDRTKKEELASYVNRWGRPDAEEVEKVVIEWPLDFLQGGICLVDAPGIKTKKKMDEVVAGVLPSTCAFIYVINSANALLPAPGSGGDSEGGDDRAGLSILLELCQRQKWGETFGSSQFDLKSTMFICNKWDCVQHNREEAVKNNYLESLKSHFPDLRDDQVFFLSCIKAVGPAGQPSPEFTRLLDGLDQLLQQSLQHKLELQYHRVHVVLAKASQCIRLKLHNAYGTQKERREAREEAERRLANFKQHANEVLRTLDQMLTATRREAEGLLRTFLEDENLQDRVYQKMLNDSTKVDDSEIGSARLITAIADEVESQLKSSPRASAFNQCIRDADIRLREEFQTKFGRLLQEHNSVIENMLNIPSFPSKFKQLSEFFENVFFQIAGAFSDIYRLARTFDSNLGIQRKDLARKLLEIGVPPDNRKEYIRCFTNQVFTAMTEAEAIKKAVNKHLKEPIQYLKTCKKAIPKLQGVDRQLMQNETRPDEEVRRIYEPKMETITQLAEKLCGFYLSDIKKHEFDVTIGKPSIWDLHKEGAQGRVYLAKLSKDGGTFMAAVKIPRLLPSGETYATFVREEENLRKLKGQHVVDCFGTYQGENKGEGNPCLGLVMEYCPKTLDEEMFGERENSPAWWGADSEKRAAAFSYTKDKAVQLCEGLKYIHDAGYMHRDLKLANVLVSSEGVVKLADLGSSKAEEAYARTNEGTPLYMAPEVLEQKKYNKSADIYSLGIILLEMWYGRTINSPTHKDLCEQTLDYPEQRQSPRLL
ncbi:uncharacterized protein LOC144866282 [Branchiostoma floridae x Branchiostoma japonicum]